MRANAIEQLHPRMLFLSLKIKDKHPGMLYLQLKIKKKQKNNIPRITSFVEKNYDIALTFPMQPSVSLITIICKTIIPSKVAISHKSKIMCKINTVIFMPVKVHCVMYKNKRSRKRENNKIIKLISFRFVQNMFVKCEL